VRHLAAYNFDSSDFILVLHRIQLWRVSLIENYFQLILNPVVETSSINFVYPVVETSYMSINIVSGPMWI
jgi:hypothetical protein